MKRKTLNKEVVYEGIGLHKGTKVKLRLIPKISGGIFFKRVDLPENENLIKMCVENTFDLTRGTNLKNQYGANIYTIEHLLSVLNIYGITDLMIEIDGNEMPICDGSAREFLEKIEEVGVKDLVDEIDEIVIDKPIALTNGDKHIIALPYDGFKITYTIKFDHTFLKSQMFEIVVDKESFMKEIARARTFCFDYEIEYLKKNNLALGGSLENAIVIKKDGVLNPNGLQFEDEFVRHKILDLIGDLKILNRPIKGHIIAIKAGHALDIEFAKKIIKEIM